jgi:alkylation response protein AidB-like acyl-CoA dehydrogenase
MSISTEEAAEQIKMLRESAADFVRRGADMNALRKRRGQLPGFDAATRRHIAELGWLGILVPEDHGGLGLGFAEMSVVLQELGKGLMAELVVAALFAGRVIQHAPNEVLKQRLLPALADGSALPAVAWQEGLGGLDAEAIELRAQPTASGLVLTGRKRFVAGAAGGAGFVISAKSPNGFELCWVDAKAPGLSVQYEWRADETPSGVLDLKEVQVAAVDVLGPGGPGGLAPLERALDEAAVLASAEMLGVMEGAMQLTLGYMRTRVQFGKPIGSFQALQHKAVDLYVQQELTRAVLDDAVRELDANVEPQERSKVASRCKARASDAGMRIGRETIQLHGAIGYTDEYDAGLYLKRALVLSGWLGNSAAHRRRFSELTHGVVTV